MDGQNAHCAGKRHFDGADVLDLSAAIPISAMLAKGRARSDWLRRNSLRDRRRGIICVAIPRGDGPRFRTESLSSMSTHLLLTQAGGPGGGSAGFLMLGPYLLIFVVFWFFLIRPQQMRAKEHRNKVAAVKPRDQVVTGGGIVGKITRVDDDFVDVEIAQGVKIKVVKSTLADVLQPGGKPAND